MPAALRTIEAGPLDIAYDESGPQSGWPCILGHGFPYDVHAYDQAAPILVQAGARVIVPYLRGYGPTRFLNAETLRSGEQAALGADLLALMDALKIERAVLGGYDWGGRAACVVAALRPERVIALVSGNSYNIQNIAKALEPASPSEEAALWYQYYFHSERGRRGLDKDRRGIARLLWRMWSPTWPFDDATFERTRDGVRQSRLCRRGHPFLSTPLRARRGRSGLCVDRDGARRATANHRPFDHHRRRRGRSEPRHGQSRQEIRRSARTPHIQGRRPQPAAGAAEGVGARGHRRAKDGERLGTEIRRQPLACRGGRSDIGDHRLSGRGSSQPA